MAGISRSSSMTTTQYRKAKQPYEAGQVRVMAWNGIATLADDGMTAIWSERVRQYWTRQEQIYGVKFAGVTLEALDSHPHIIFSRAVVDRVLPGPRLELH